MTNKQGRYVYLTEDQAKQIKEKLSAGSVSVVAEQLSLSKSVVQRLKTLTEKEQAPYRVGKTVMDRVKPILSGEKHLVNKPKEKKGYGVNLTRQDVIELHGLLEEVTERSAVQQLGLSRETIRRLKGFYKKESPYRVVSSTYETLKDYLSGDKKLKEIAPHEDNRGRAPSPVAGYASQQDMQNGVGIRFRTMTEAEHHGHYRRAIVKVLDTGKRYHGLLWRRISLEEYTDSMKDGEESSH